MNDFFGSSCAHLPWRYREAMRLLWQTLTDPAGCPWWVLQPGTGCGALVLSDAGRCEVLSLDVVRIEATASELWETNPKLRERLLPLLTELP